VHAPVQGGQVRVARGADGIRVEHGAGGRIGIATKEAALNPDATEPVLRRLATAIRLRAVGMVAPQGFGYLGQALSAAEQYAAVYGAAYRPGTDRVVCSPGHYVIAAYAAAAETGLIDEAALASYGQDGSSLEAIGAERSPVPEYTCGSLGQGLSAAAGFALGDRLTGRHAARTFAFVSDGELQEGQVWEAAMFAGHHRLARLTVLLDANNSQVDGPVDSITTIEPVAAKWQAFGWDAADLDGHDVAAIAAALAAAGRATRPQVLICRTSTRHGLACLPPDADGHFIKLPADLAAAAAAELRAEADRLAPETTGHD
jgi:transketolase